MKNIIKKIFLFLGIHVTVTTSKSDLLNLIDKLKPVSTNYELVRIGPEGDGGYLLPNDFDGIEAVFSPGVGDVSLFEDDCAKMGMNIFLADYSVDGPAMNNKKFSFLKKYIGSFNSEYFISLDDWVEKNNTSLDSDLILQMDIEGFEYETIYSMSGKLTDRFRILVIEFHELDMLFNKAYFTKISNAFEKILRTHSVVHIHPNNCCQCVRKGEIEIPPVMEFTFIRRDRIKKSKHVKQFPHKLDFDTTNKKRLTLPKCWYAD